MLFFSNTLHPFNKSNNFCLWDNTSGSAVSNKTDSGKSKNTVKAKGFQLALEMSKVIVTEILLRKLIIYF